jgi:hypothetical protein
MIPVEHSRDDDPSVFAIEVAFVQDSEDPARVFRAMTGLIEACREIDVELAQPLGASVRPVLLLQDIEAGSVKAWLRSAVESVDDESLKSGDYKRVIGTYLVKGKRRMVEYLNGRRFHSRELSLHPGDALRGEVEVETKYGSDGEVIAVHHRILQVREILEKA